MWITGQVVDDRGRALSGASIEASGPAAVSKRAVITNAQGTYVLQDLRPGVYNLTFACAGFSTVHRETVDLSSWVATINATLLRSRSQ
jgi:hypothetical protein